MEQDRIYRGQIYYIHPQEVVGSEQEGGRPAVIVSNDVCNEHSRVVEVVFLTTKETLCNLVSGARTYARLYT